MLAADVEALLGTQSAVSSSFCLWVSQQNALAASRRPSPFRSLVAK